MKSQFAPTNTKEIWVVGGGGRERGGEKLVSTFRLIIQIVSEKKPHQGKTLLNICARAKKTNRKYRRVENEQQQHRK